MNNNKVYARQYAQLNIKHNFIQYIAYSRPTFYVIYRRGSLLCLSISLGVLKNIEDPWCS